jgi:MYXO-CTERM domain-containing protein
MTAAPKPLLMACACVAALGTFAGERLGSAESVTLDIRNVSREARRADDRYPWWISRQDCLDDVKYTFGVVLKDSSGRNFVVYKSSSLDCTTAENRNEATDPCTLMFEQGSPAAGTLDVEIGAKKLAGGDCDTDLTSAAITLYFMLLDGGATKVGTHATWTKQTTVDLSGPSAPSDLSVGSGEGALQLSWKEPAADDIYGYQFYCSRQGSVGAAGSAGGAGAAGDTGDAGATSSSCSAAGLAAGEIPDDVYMCGSVKGSLITEGRAEDLANGVPYAVGVSAVDRVGNVGPLSGLDCATPAEVDDFYELYRRQGGVGGGGYCTVTRRDHRPHWAFGLLAVGLALAAVRRRSR